MRRERQSKERGVLTHDLADRRDWTRTQSLLQPPKGRRGAVGRANIIGCGPYPCPSRTTNDTIPGSRGASRKLDAAGPTTFCAYRGGSATPREPQCPNPRRGLCWGRGVGPGRVRRFVFEPMSTIKTSLPSGVVPGAQGARGFVCRTQGRPVQGGGVCRGHILLISEIERDWSDHEASAEIMRRRRRRGWHGDGLEMDCGVRGFPGRRRRKCLRAHKWRADNWNKFTYTAVY